MVTLFAHISPHALQRVLGPSGPRRIIGVHFSLMPQCLQEISCGWAPLLSDAQPSFVPQAVALDAESSGLDLADVN